MNHLHITYTNLVVVYKELCTNQLQPLELLIYQDGNTFALNIFISPTRGIGISFLLFGFFRFFFTYGTLHNMSTSKIYDSYYVIFYL